MKRFLEILALYSLTFLMMVVATMQEHEEYIEPVTAKSTIILLGDSDFEKLYHLEDEKRISNNNIVEVTYPEAQLLMRVARAEGGTTLLGQLWVMRTLLNRVDSEQPDFQDVNTIGEVVFQAGQFDVVTTGAYMNVELNENSHYALAMCEGGWNETDGALFFESSLNTNNSWHKKNLSFIKEVEGNRFYK